MSFDTLTGATTASRTAANAAINNPKLGNPNMDQGDFLKLMTAQLKNQDPFSPVDNGEMVAQMAQFSSLAGISEMSSTLKAISERMNGTSNAEAMSWIGRTVLSPGNVAYPRVDGSLGGTIELAADAENVSLAIEGPNGALLRTVDLGSQKQGAIDFEWDGTTSTGEAAGDGPFTLRVIARNAANQSVATQTNVWAPVTSVTLNNQGSPVLTLPGIGQVPVEAVRKVG